MLRIKELKINEDKFLIFKKSTSQSEKHFINVKAVYKFRALL